MILLNSNRFFRKVLIRKVLIQTGSDKKTYLEIFLNLSPGNISMRPSSSSNRSNSLTLAGEKPDFTKSVSLVVG
jgi:hypothetical protein